MSNRAPIAPETDSSFDSFFAEAESRDSFWISKAKLQFTEEMLQCMKHAGIGKSELAEKLNVRPAQISRLCSGLNNFTIETMVRVARALNCEFKSHLQPAGLDTMWINVLREDTAATQCWSAKTDEFQPIASEQFQQKVSHVLSATT